MQQAERINPFPTGRATKLSSALMYGAAHTVSTASTGRATAKTVSVAASIRHQKTGRENPTGCALFDYALGVVSGVGSATILKLNVLGNAKKSPPTTVAVTI